VRALPGVQSATLSYTYPMNYDNQSAYIRAEGQPPDPTNRGPIAGYNDVGTDYFETMGTPVLRGRALTPADQESAVRVAIINQTMAKKLWPNQDPIGKRFIADNANDKPIEVVGVTGNGKYEWIFEEPSPYYYTPIGQNYHSLRILQVRTAVAPESLAMTVVKQIHELDANLPLYDVMGMQEALNGGNGFFLLNMGADFAGALGALGLVLALVGVYGVVSYAASRRTHEIGIRMALGAGRPRILKMVLTRGFGLVLAGIATGVVVALGLTRFMANLLFGIRPADPVTFGSVALLLAAISLVACYIPARRATLVDPLVALRHE
jgi:predicted permease